jgi:hypothetical protein
VNNGNLLFMDTDDFILEVGLVWDFEIRRDQDTSSRDLWPSSSSSHEMRYVGIMYLVGSTTYVNTVDTYRTPFSRQN